jgi:hypothetical protein
VSSTLAQQEGGVWATPVVDDASDDELEDALVVTEESGRQSPSAIEESREVWA